jgi:hypothetical protein
MGVGYNMKGQEEDTQSSDFEAIPTHAREVSLNELLALLIRDRRVVLKEAVVPYALRVRTCAASA